MLHDHARGHCGSDHDMDGMFCPKSEGNPATNYQYSTISTLLVVSITFSISLAPGIFFSVLSPALDLDLNKIQSRKWYHTLRIISPLAVCINCAANPFIYCVTIPSFGGFVKMKLRYAGNIVRVFMLPWLRLRRHRIRISDMAVRVRRTAESEL